MASGAMYRAILPASNAATFSETFKATDAETGQLIDFSGGEITFNVVEKGVVKLTATKSNGKITLPSTGQFKVTFSSAEMSNLEPKAYDVGCIAVVSGQTLQILIGKLSVQDGFAP